MRMMLLNLPLLAVVLPLSACHEHYYTSEYSERLSQHAPVLNAFHVVDSYGNTSEYLSGGPLFISPFEDSGFFELYWDVGAGTNYRVDLRINDVPSLEYSTLVSSAVCGGQRQCGQDSYQFCQYSADLSLECDLPESVATSGRVDIAPLFYDIPEVLYLILEVCDTQSFYCEHQMRELIFE